MLDEVLRRHSYKRVTSVPLAMLDLPYRSLDHYLDSLPDKTGSYFRRKMRSAKKMRIEYRSSIVGLEARIAELFDSTLKQSKVDYGDFEKLDPDYFPKVVHGMGDKAQLMLCWQGEELLSFQLFLVGRDRVLAKQIGMKYPQGRELNLYFVNWLKLIEFAIEHRIPCVEMGATTYATKILFGGYLERRWLHFRFRSGLWNRMLNPVAPLFDFEKNDPELAEARRRRQDVHGPAPVAAGPARASPRAQRGHRDPRRDRARAALTASRPSTATGTPRSDASCRVEAPSSDRPSGDRACSSISRRSSGSSRSRPGCCSS